MVNNFKKRKDEFEKKFSHDEEMRFKVHSRCAKLFGSWAAEKLGKEGDDGESYAKQMVSLSMQKGGMQAIKEKVLEDLKAHDVDVSEHMVETTLSEKMEEAEKQITQ